MCTKFQVAILTKMAEFCRFECPKRPLFTLFTRISTFSFFHFLYENLTQNMYHTTQTQNFKFDVFEILTFDDLHLAKRHKGLGGDIQRYPRHDPCRSPALFQFDTAALPGEANRDRKSIILPLTRPVCDVIIDHTNRILQHIQKAQARGYQMPFSDRKSVHYFARWRGGGAKRPPPHRRAGSGNIPSGRG